MFESDARSSQSSVSTTGPRQALTLVRHLGYSWSPGRTLKEMGTLSARRLAQNASQIARCTALYTTSRPVRATKAMGRQQSSGGSSHWEPAMVTARLRRHLQEDRAPSWRQSGWRKTTFSDTFRKTYANKNKLSHWASQTGQTLYNGRLSM